MRQAIEEGFILDVFANYVTYQTEDPSQNYSIPYGRGDAKHKADLYHRMARLLARRRAVTVAAFLSSSQGGTLLIGVADDASVIGLAPDCLTLHKEGKGDRDLFQVALRQSTLHAVGAAAATNATTQIHEVDSNDLCRVHVSGCGHVVDASVTVTDAKDQNQKNSIFYVRIEICTSAIDDPTEREKGTSPPLG
jgi:hypothetical protein